MSNESGISIVKLRATIKELPPEFGRRTWRTRSKQGRRDTCAQAEARAGASSPQSSDMDMEGKAEAEAREVFIEATIMVEAAGRPRVADG